MKQRPVGEASRGFEDLKCWQLARRLMIECHKLADLLPPIKRYDLAPQIRKSSKSGMTNISEGYGSQLPPDYPDFLPPDPIPPVDPFLA